MRKKGLFKLNLAYVARRFSSNLRAIGKWESRNKERQSREDPGRETTEKPPARMAGFFVSPIRWRTGHCHWLRRLTRQLKSPKGQHQGTWSNITNYNADLVHANRTGHRSDQTTKRLLAVDVCICLNHQERWSLASLSACSRRWNYEVLFSMHRHGTHDQMMCLIFLFVDQSLISETLLPLESIKGLEKGFCMGIFKFLQWDLEQTTTKSTIIVYTSLDFSFSAIYQANTTSDSFVLIVHSALISCVNTIHKTCHPVVKICNRGGNKIYWSSGLAVPRGFAAHLRNFASLCVHIQIA